MIKNIYDKILFKYSSFAMAFLFIFIGVMGFYSTKLEIDASAETLMVQNDKDLKFFRENVKIFGTQSFLFLTFEPKKGSILDENNLNILKEISKEFSKLPKVDNVLSILNTPLLESPVISISQLASGEIRTLGTIEKPNKKLIKKEFLTSPIYSNNLVSNDFTTCAIILNLKGDEKYYSLLNKREKLLLKEKLTFLEEKKLKVIKKDFKLYRDKQREIEANNIASIREINKKYEKKANIFLGGAEMVASDVIGYVKNDLLIYGGSLVIILIIVLWVIFRKIRWIVLPIGICILSVVSTTGLLGYFDWEVTVISSNFIALQLIITISIVLHLIVRYRELNNKFKHASQYKLVINTVLSKIVPTFFAIFTTIIGFGSLLLATLEPVKNLGLMMSAGIAISLAITYIVFPIMLIHLKREKEYQGKPANYSLIHACVKIVENHSKAIYVLGIIIVVFAVTAFDRLIVENSFINYFKKSTPIYQGMEVIDKELGGTTPLDVIIQFDNDNSKIIIEEKSSKENYHNDDFDDFEEEFEEIEDKNQYWFTKNKLDVIVKIHKYLENVEGVGKVVSLNTLLEIGKIINNGKELDGISLALMYKKLPDFYKKIILTPYVNIEKNQARISMRIIDSKKDLRRNELIKKINKDINNILIDNEKTTFRLTNLMLLYNNLLQSLFDSQISTLGFTIGILYLMFLILFRSFKLSVIALIVNIIPVSIVFGIMGWFEIPLDIMTITIAAIAFGMGVDDTIHYIYRFKEEFKVDHDYHKAMMRSHLSIGYAMYYTTMVICMGFSILALSNLIPTIYFGILTVVAMISLLTADILLLPRLLITLKPFDKK